MTDRKALALNSPRAIGERLAVGRTTHPTVLGMVGLRTVTAFAVVGISATIALILGTADPTAAAARWWIVTATLIDLVCLGALVLVLRREDLRIRDLLGWRGPRDLLWIPVVVLIVAPGLAASSFLTSLAYPPAAPPEITVVDVPMPAALYAVLVWPVIWTITEELVYLGYALPRLEVLLGRGTAVVLVLAFWSAQHLALPFLPNSGYLLHRAITPLPIVGAMTIAYFVVDRRLVPLIVVHWLGDLSTAVLAVS